MDDEALLDTARRLAQRLQPSDLDETLANITSAAVELLPNVHFSSITVLRADGTLGTAAPTDELIVRLDAEQYRLKEGPCYDAATHTDQVTSADLSVDERFPAYGKVAAHTWHPIPDRRPVVRHARVERGTEPVLAR